MSGVITFDTSESGEDGGLTEYEVSVHNIFYAASPEDAVMQAAAWLADCSYEVGYRVTDPHGNSARFDAAVIYEGEHDDCPIDTPHRHEGFS